jgi:hypothetical protein
MRTNPTHKLTLSAVAMLSLGGCMLFIHDKTPIASVPDGDREVVQPGLNEPDQIRLTKPTKVSGVDLAAGSVIKHDGENNYRLVSVAPVMVGKLALPAGSEIEMVKADDVERWNWNGVVHMANAASFSGHEVKPGDRVVFAAALFSAPTLMQFRLGEAREVRGKPYPAGTLFDVDANGKITGAYTPEAQSALARGREERARERKERDRQCEVTCSIVTDFHEHAKCLGNCRNGT